MDVGYRGECGPSMDLDRESNHLRRSIQLLLGLFIFGLSVALMIRAELGLGPWDAFHVGLAEVTGASVGTIMILVGLVIVLSALMIAVRPGPGTIANMILIGVFADLLLPIVPTAPNPWWAWLYLSTAIVLCGLATGMYIGAGYGAGPRDSLMVGIAHRSGRSLPLVRPVTDRRGAGLGRIRGVRAGARGRE